MAECEHVWRFGVGLERVCEKCLRYETDILRDALRALVKAVKAREMNKWMRRAPGAPDALIGLEEEVAKAERLLGSEEKRT